MKVSELMTGKTPSDEYAGITTADDMVLALNIGTPKGETPADYQVAQEGITEHTGALEAQTAESQYIRSGQVTTKTGTSRTFTVNGDRFCGDAFQDALLAHAMKYGTGQAVIVDYVYFNILTGKGEQGQVSVAIEDDLAGAAGENASWTATLTSRGTPTEYTYAPAA